ncbi:NAD(P)-dependent oxidoreductase [bacterium]|nr:NAD(P)-dependent oxidoreductase [bacterium]
MKIIVTGARGLVGTRFLANYRDKYDIVTLGSSHEQRVDITDREALLTALKEHSDAQALIHLAAYTNVNGAFEQTGDKSGAAWQVNVTGTENIAEACREFGFYLIHVSTAFVFDGQKKTPYVEDDQPHPIEWYGQTKYEAEKIVTTSGAKSVILRIDQPFTHVPSAKVDTLWRVINGLRAGQLYPQFTNHYFGPTYIEDLTRIFDFCLRQQPTGLYHASSGETWSDYDFACSVRDILHLKTDVAPGDLEAYLRTTKRPYQRQTALNIDHLQKIIDFKLRTIREAISQVQLA